MDGIKRDISKMKLLLRSLARNESTTVINRTLKNDVKSVDDEDIDVDTIDSNKNYKTFEIYKEVALMVMDKSNYPKEKQKDAVIALWSFIHGIASIATMSNVKYDEDWEQKITDLLRVFNSF